MADAPRSSLPAHGILPGIRCDTVLCWVGSSEIADEVVQVGRALAGHCQGRCHVLMCLDTPFRGLERGEEPPSQEPVTPELIAREETRLARLYGTGVHTIVVPGPSIAEVRRYARNHCAGLVVMGEQALAIERSYGESLLDRPPCPVMILVQPKSSGEPAPQPTKSPQSRSQKRR